MRTRLLFLALLASNVLMAQVPLKVKTTEKEYQVEDATHITFSEDLAVQAIHSKTDSALLLPMRDVREVILRDTLQNVTDYILADADCKLYRWAVFNDEYAETSYMRSFFYSNFADPAQWDNATAVTPGLQSRFALFVPTDSAFADTVPYGISFVSRQPAAISLQYKWNSRIPVTARLCYYDPETGVVKQRITSVALSDACIVGLLNEMLLQHTVFFDRPEDRELGIRSGNEYFKTMDGNVIRVAADGKSVQGIQQMDNEAKGLEVFTTSNIIDSHQKNNGAVYKIDSPILPPAIQKSAYSVLSGEGYEEFFKLCQVDYDVLEALSLVDPNYHTASTCEKLRAFFSTFVKKNGADYNLSFFPNHPFTLYAPTNEAVHRAIADGLPTWESLAEAYGGGVGSDAEREEGQRKVYELINFVRYHFHFGTEIADKLPFAAREHATPVILPDGHVTPALRVSSAGNGTLSVTDATGQTLQVMDEGKNVFVRDVECSVDPAGMVSNLYMVHSSPGVIHRINGVLRYK